ncbi:MAG: glycosyltransferase family 2 protein [Gemmatimonadaceae bacterium]|nr:glycosyltransferase family 2 protein [Gemmatimonadaceae bacterium]
MRSNAGLVSDLEVHRVHPLPKFSLVLATVGRVELVERFLKSVAAQGYPNLEVLVADQNTDERLTPLIKRLSHRLSIRHLRPPLGLSRARNAALRHVTGDVVAFPDDDSVYPPELLHRVAHTLAKYPGIGGLVGCPVVHETGAPFRGFGRQAVDLTHRNVWSLTSSIGLFLRADTVEMVGSFDESLGLGAGTPWGSNEDRDYPLRAIDLGVRIRYEPSIRVEHPIGDYGNHRQAFSYGAGLGRVLRLRATRLSDVAALVVVRPLGGLALSLLRGRWSAATFYLHSLRGRIYGWRAPLVNEDRSQAPDLSPIHPE